MAYQALYRVWRPQRFDDMVGQQIITKTLKNALITNKSSHAYLFTGPRGTGKTSAAKIFAKAVNCHYLKDGEPCNQCETCKAVNDGSLNDVIEIDAASNNGVEEIRDIRDKVKYAPTQADYKVYIIDEVHMLSTGAFNALLKTLEEPPANVIFILATTEPHKIPATIISRTQRFDFKRIRPVDILQRMEYILQQKGIVYEDSALKVIAKAAEGGMRDALSILDQTLSYGDAEKGITYDNALLVTGSVTLNLITEYMERIIAKETKEALVIVQKLLEAGKDASRFVEDITSYCQDILLYKQDPQMVEEMELGMIDAKFKDLVAQVSDQFVYQLIDELNNIANSLRYTSHPEVYLEVLTVKATHLDDANNLQQPAVSDDGQVQSLLKQVKQLQDQVAQLQSGKVNLSSDAPSKVAKPAKKAAATMRVNLEKIYPVLDQATRKALNQYKEIWAELVQELTVTQRAMMHVSAPVAASENGVIVSFDYPFLFQKANGDQDLIDALENGMDRIMGRTPKMVFVPESQWPEIRSNYLKQKNNGNNQPVEPAVQEPVVDDVVQQAEALFGADFVEVKND